MPHLHKILEKIEELRKKINDLGTLNHLTDPELLKVSQELDALLVKYQKLLGKTQQNKKSP
ncbi:hypothetical protein P22_2317 [Propionispora sp. 2/2-37]|uniref:aspartyl-phosphate phosphatase Spo0E family protein n=1 Tax=Propionispora sp. 2/2-37 TaxID=1677858 RepID=UPI0006BB6102|nr:aspartyl-phosphate phosphatase Spo0E family protein [Propionispora sp. 2/2-37]CUH96228.1 hypothetical protein P22_2317 [Propionispora sp. 2/2-37]